MNDKCECSTHLCYKVLLNHFRLLKPVKNNQFNRNLLKICDVYKSKETNKDIVDIFDISIDTIKLLHLFKIKSDLLNREYLRDLPKYMDNFEVKMQTWNMMEGFGTKDRRLQYPNLYSNANMSQPIFKIRDAKNSRGQKRPQTCVRGMKVETRNKNVVKLDSKQLSSALESLHKEIEDASSHSSKDLNLHMVEINSNPFDGEDNDFNVTSTDTNQDLKVVDDDYDNKFNPKYNYMRHRLKRSRIKKKEIPLSEILKEKEKQNKFFGKLFNMNLNPKTHNIVDKMIGRSILGLKCMVYRAN